MNPIIKIGFFDAKNVEQGAAVNFGQGTVELRNCLKENLGAAVIGDAIVNGMVNAAERMDEDRTDCASVFGETS